MKIYLFCPETGFYQGEDFADVPSLCPGRTALPPYATTVAPPPYRRGEVPVFSSAGNTWHIRSIAALRSGADADPGRDAGGPPEGRFHRQAG